MTRKRMVITLRDYERIFRIIYSVIYNHAHTSRACIFFAIVGALILKKKYNIDAYPRAGAAAYLVDKGSANVVLFGKWDSDSLVSSRDAFHCWVEADGVIIDFLSPLFEESVRSRGHDIVVPSRMFQRPISAMSSTLTEFENDGDFILLPNQTLSKDLFAEFMARATATDLANVCVTWFVKPPKPLREMSMINDLGEIEKLVLRGSPLTNAW